MKKESLFPPDPGPFWMERHDATDYLSGSGIRFPPQPRIVAEAEAVEMAPDSEFSPWSLPGFQKLPGVLETQDILVRRFGRSTQESALKSGWRTSLKEASAFTRWERFGRRLYVLDAVTAELLEQTDLPDIPFGDLLFPLPAFYLHVPSEIRLPFVGSGKAEGVLVHIAPRYKDKPDPVEITLVVTGEGGPARERYVTSLDLLVRLDRSVRELVQDVPSAAREDPDGNYRSDTVPSLWRMIVGFVLYLMSEHPQVEPVPANPRQPILTRNPKKRRAREKAALSTRHLGYLYVGRNESTEEGAHPEGDHRTLTVPVWVRGHFRQQPHGPGGSLRRLKWIKPYRKGPDLAEAVRLHASRVQRARIRARDGA